MTIQEFYSKIGGNYDEVMTRLMKEERITKFVRKFTDSTDYTEMLNAIEAQNWPDAFRFSHNLKGVSLNLAFTKLGQSSSILCDYFRNGDPTEDFSAQLKTVKKDYADTVNAIKEID